MPMDNNNKDQLVTTISPIIPRFLVISFSIALFSLALIVGMVIYKKVPVEFLGMKIGYQMEENQTGDIPFLLTEVQQLKEQKELLEKLLTNLFNENEVKKNQLKACEDKSHSNSNG